MVHTYDARALAFIAAQHPILNLIHADALLHNLGLRSAVQKARAMASVDVDHVWQGNRYWKTGDVIDAGQAQLAA